jgi:hypothetical protein
MELDKICKIVGILYNIAHMAEGLIKTIGYREARAENGEYRRIALQLFIHCHFQDNISSNDIDRICW